MAVYYFVHDQPVGCLPSKPEVNTGLEGP